MLDRIYTESCDPHFQEFRHIPRYSVLDMFPAGIKILQPGQAAVPYFLGIMVIADIMVARMEIILRVPDRREIPFGIKRAARSPCAFLTVYTGSMVDNSVSNDAYARSAARRDHLSEFSFSPQFGIQIITGDLI